MMKTFYQYECKDCEEFYFTPWQGTTEGTIPFCPNCGNEGTSELTGEEINHG